jgi:hypothetical protein
LSVPQIRLSFIFAWILEHTKQIGTEVKKSTCLAIHEIPLHDVQVGVYCTLGTRTVKDPVFYTDAILREICKK